nr:hypothetical protein [Paenibacillus sp. VKM B-2647]
MSRLLRPPAQLTKGSIRLEGTELTALTDAEFDRLRWSRISFVLQSAMNNLNPVMRIREQMVDTIVTHRKMSAGDALQRARSSSDWSTCLRIG